ncbi:hypothetical protein B2J86_04415 [Acidovorax sp. SRB_14]|uniref:sterol desaturase family protein n=1 Tax=Acidovorax sp. SRB_14 TaxID=1962699 RepID=UPI001566CE18|nr:sterol desaturase family protein [Acidovorax sp. SRB_14]NMM80182.1 hypothetical protein [Acidovorax sp. SRB_14]
MRLFALEHSKAAYLADFALYGAAVLALAVALGFFGPEGRGAELAATALLGLGAWTLVEYGLHRFVLHGLQPFRRWHALHHAHPAALICTPTLLSAALIALLVFLPALLLSDLWRACALTLGLLAGYLTYAVVHHALHHGMAPGRWLQRRRHWHALHHRAGDPGDCYGVTTALWDRVFGTGHRPDADRKA